MEEVFVQYFNELFKSSNPSNDLIQLALGVIYHCISEEINSFLLQDYSKEVVKDVLFHMGSTKALGLDEFPALFYQKFWN